MKKRRKPSSTPRTTISIAEDLLDDYECLRRWLRPRLEAGEMSLSRYLITAALLCMAADIDDPDLAAPVDLLLSDLENPATWTPEPKFEIEEHKNGHVSMTTDALDALNKLFA